MPARCKVVPGERNTHVVGQDHSATVQCSIRRDVDRITTESHDGEVTEVSQIGRRRKHVMWSMCQDLVKVVDKIQ
jgi:hypothetical protein